MIGLGRQEMQITLSNLKEVTPLSESLVKATKLSSLAHPYLELDIVKKKKKSLLRISISLISDLQKSPQKLKKNKKEKLRLIYEYIKIKLKTI